MEERCKALWSHVQDSPKLALVHNPRLESEGLVKYMVMEKRLCWLASYDSIAPLLCPLLSSVVLIWPVRCGPAGVTPYLVIHMDLDNSYIKVLLNSPQ